MICFNSQTEENIFSTFFDISKKNIYKIGDNFQLHGFLLSQKKIHNNQKAFG